MTDKPRPHRTEAAKAAAAARQAREAEALRANLLRRKQQARGLAQAREGEAEAEDEPQVPGESERRDG